jgi:hypothetical protein
MWDPCADLAVSKRDICCNTHAYFRVRKSGETGFASHPEWLHGPQDAHYVLDLTVCCRSNDSVWGAYGANAVHFSVLLEYMAARIGVSIGTYFQVSNNFHVYQNVLDKIDMGLGAEDLYQGKSSEVAQPTPLVTHPELFDFDLQLFFSGTPAESMLYTNTFFSTVAVPMKDAYAYWRAKDKTSAMVTVLERMPPFSDWRIAAERWFQRRMVKGTVKSEEGIGR